MSFSPSAEFPEFTSSALWSSPNPAIRTLPSGPRTIPGISGKASTSVAGRTEVFATFSGAKVEGALEVSLIGFAASPLTSTVCWLIGTELKTISMS